MSDAEDRAVKAVEKFGGSVVRDDKNPARPVVTVSFVGAEMRDAEMKEALKELAAFKDLKTLDLRGTQATQVTDAGLKELAALKDLQTLDLSSTGVTDDGAKELQNTLSGCVIFPRR
jgi:hypothetical protein